MRKLLRLAFVLPLVPGIAWACSATDNATGNTGAGGLTGTGGSGGGGDSSVCGFCVGSTYTPCLLGQPTTPIECEKTCVSGLGCVLCAPNSTVCVGNEVHKCSADGQNTD